MKWYDRPWSGDEDEGPSRMPVGLWLVGALLILVAFALPWYSYSNGGPLVSLNGAALLSLVPELGLLAASALALALFAVGYGRRRVWAAGRAHETLPRLGVSLLALVTFVLPIEALFRGSSRAASLWGGSLYNDAGIGWGLALLGGTLALLGVFMLWLRSSPAEIAAPSKA